MRQKVGIPCLPKRFCCFFKLKLGVYLICAYLILIGVLQLISLTGVLHLGVNNLLLVGDIACMIFAILSLVAIKKIKVGTPLKILGVLWGILIIMNAVSHLQATTDDLTDIFKEKTKQLNSQNSTVSALHFDFSLIAEQAIFTSEDEVKTQNETALDSSSQQEEVQEYFQDLMKNIDDQQLQIIFILWTIYKIYCTLCVFKLGLKIQTKHSRNFYYKLY